VAKRAWFALVVLVAGIGLVAAPAAAAPAPQASLVRIDVFSAAKGGGRPAPPAANCTNDDPSAYGTTPVFTGWTTNGLDGKAHLNRSTVPSSLTTAPADLQAGFNAWSSASHAPSFTVLTDGTLTKPTANRQADFMFGRTGGSTIAVTYTWRWSDGLYESDTLFSSQLAWREIRETGDGCNEAVAAYDFQGIATHELGHLYGLDHPPNDRFATMYAYGYTGETLKRTLATSDRNGITTLY